MLERTCQDCQQRPARDRAAPARLQPREAHLPLQRPRFSADGCLRERGKPGGGVTDQTAPMLEHHALRRLLTANKDNTMKTLIPLLMLFASTNSLFARIDVIAGPITNQANEHVYYLLAPSDWHSARAAAWRLGGHLVTIQDADENAWVRSTFGLADGFSRNLWLGLTDQDQEGIWKWITDEPLTYTDWENGEPNNFHDGTEHYGHIWHWGLDTGGRWNDATAIGSDVGLMPHGVVELEPSAKLGPLTIRVSELELQWPSITNQVCQVQYRSVLTTNTWTDLFGTNIVGNGDTIRLIEKVPFGDPSKFYRVLPLTNSIPQ